MCVGRIMLVAPVEVFLVKGDRIKTSPAYARDSCIIRVRLWNRGPRKAAAMHTLHRVRKSPAVGGFTSHFLPVCRRPSVLCPI